MLRRLLTGLAVAVALFAALPSTAANPVLVIYPFAINGTAPEDLGEQVSAKIAAEIKALGGITVVMGAPSAKPADYRSAARAAGADLYLSGSIVPIGPTRYSAIEQLVSTHSGLVQWSVSLQFRAVDDIAAQGAVVRDQLVRSSATTAPNVTAAPVVLITAPPLNGLAVLPVTGSALDGDKAYAQRARRRNAAASRLQGDAVGGFGLVRPADQRRDAVRGDRRANARSGRARHDPRRRARFGANDRPRRGADLRLRQARLDPQATVVNHIEPIANDAIRGAIEDAISAFPAPS